MRIVIDIDGTICETKKPGQTYDQLRVNPGAAEKIKQLKAAGHYIILQTARHMKTTGGDVQKVIEKVGAVTEEWLKKNNIQYDEIQFGKPYNQVLIDDRAFVFEGWEDFKPEDFEGSKVNVLILTHSKAAIESAAKILDGLGTKARTQLIFAVPGRENSLMQQIKHSFKNQPIIIAVPSTANQLQATIAAEPYINNFQQLIITTGNGASKYPGVGNVEEENLEGLLTVAAGKGEGFVKNDEWGFVEEISSQPISKESAAGFYFFNNGRDFLSCAKSALRHKQSLVAACYNQLIKRGQKVKAVRF